MDIRWEQRFSNFTKAMDKLRQSVAYIHENFEVDNNEDTEDGVLDEMIKEGLIQRFEYTHELAWNVMKDFFEQEGNTTLMGSRSATREAFKKGIITDGENWMDMISSRNLTTHTYNEVVAEEITSKITSTYYPLFKIFQSKMNTFLI